MPSHTASLLDHSVFRHAAYALLIWLGACALVFIPYEMIERLWLDELTGQSRGLAHIVRGALASLLATLATAMYLLRRAVPRLESSLGLAVPITEAESATVREGLAAWMLGLRWVAVFASSAVVAFATQASRRLDPEAVALLWTGVGLLLLFNASLTTLGPRRLASQRALGLQVAGDVLILGWLVHHAGGLGNRFAGFFVFHAVIAAVILHSRQARAVAAAIAAFVLGLALLEATRVIPPGCLRDASGSCAATADPLLHLGAGIAVATMVVVCGLIVSALVLVLRSERDRLARASAKLSAHAEHLAAAQSQLQRERQNLQTIIDCMADAVLYVTPDGIVRLRNRAAECFWPQGTPADDGLRACHPPERWKDLIDKISDPAPVELHPIFEVDGRSYEGSYARVWDSDGSLRGVVMVARDITERIETQAWRMQQERMAVVGKLAAGLAHELNNPLGAIALFAQHALGKLDAGHPLAEHLGTVLRNANLCKKIVRDLLEYARQRPPERRQASLAELMGDVGRTLEPQAQASKVLVQHQGSSSAAGSVYGDVDQLRQVLVNLGLNAIEAMPEGGTLTFNVAPAPGGRVRIDVRDTGQGIAPEEHERIFAAFHTTKPEGTGLGLTVARDLVTAHGGTITVASQPGRGSIFTVILPSHSDERAAEAAA